MTHISRHIDAFAKQTDHANLFMYDAEKSAVSIEYIEAHEGFTSEWHLPSTGTIHFFIIEGKGTFVINEDTVEAVAKDLVNVEAGSVVKVSGVMKFITILGPATERLKAYDEN